MNSTYQLIPGWARWLAVAFGVLLTATGAVAVFVTSNSAGAGFLVAAGVVTGALGMFANTIQSVKGGGVEFVLARAAAATLKDAKDAEEHGQTDVAQALREQAKRLMSDIEPLASMYEQMRRDNPPSRTRTLQLERLSAESAKELAPYTDRAFVEALFDSGAEGKRWASIILMEHNPGIASGRVLEAVLSSPLSRFELYHALKVIEGMTLLNLPSPDLAGLLATVEKEQRSGRLRHPDSGAQSDVDKLAERILARADRLRPKL